MRNIQLADALLVLVTSREHASTTVGDLLEDSAGRGRFWFWSSILRTLLAQLWRGLGAEPLHLTSLALRGVILSFALWLAAFVSFVAGGALIFLLLQTSGFVHGNSASFPRAAGLYFTAAGLAIQFRLGRWMARRAPNSALAACVMFVAESAIAQALLGSALLAWYIGRFPEAASEPVATLDILFPFGLARMALYSVPLVAGAWWARRRTALHASS